MKILIGKKAKRLTTAACFPRGRTSMGDGPERSKSRALTEVLEHLRESECS